MKRLLLCLFIIMAVTIIQPEEVQANDNATSYDGLYLIDGQNIKLNRVDVSVSIESVKMSSITATYEMTNVGKNTEYIYLGIPVTENKITNSKFSFLPYWYNSMIVNGKEINPRVEELTLNFDNWRTYSIPLAIKAEETKTAQISYAIENIQDTDGKVTFDVNMEHLKSWGEIPESILVESFFNPQSVKVYNFDNTFSVEPTEITSQYSYLWEMIDQNKIEGIEFSYNFVDDTIISQLQNLNDDNINAMIKAYRERKYDDVINIGKKYIEKDTLDSQNLVYLFMVDAFMAEKQYKEALAIYDLIETDFNELEGINDKIKEKNLYNKVICYRELNEYTNMYTLISYELNYSKPNSFMVDWLEKQINIIPENELSKIEKEYRPPSTIEKFLNKFLEGELSSKVVAISAVALIIIVIIMYIIRKRKKNKYFF